MNDKLLLHDKTRKQIEGFLKNPSHTLLITGPAGSGKATLAKSLAAQLLEVPVDNLEKQPYYTALKKPSDKQEIPIESVRRLIHSLTLKPVSSKGDLAKRVVWIDDAQTLSEEAQNALLKSIEEPPQSTVFILAAPNETDVLPTIASRAQKVFVAPISLRSAQGCFKSAYGLPAIESAWNLSQGSIGLLSAILEGDQNHPLKNAVDSAKKFLKMGRYERVIFLDGLSSDKPGLILMLDALNRVLTALGQSAIKNDNIGQSQKIIESRKLINSAFDALNTNTLTRLICLQLALQLPV